MRGGVSFLLEVACSQTKMDVLDKVNRYLRHKTSGVQTVLCVSIDYKRNSVKIMASASTGEDPVELRKLEVSLAKVCALVSCTG